MRKQPPRESKGRRVATSNKQKRDQLQKKRDVRRKKEEQRRKQRPPRRDVDYDAGFPPGAIPADLAQQTPNNSYSGPKLYYVDEPFMCVTCGRAEVWTAAQQKWYYEVAKGSIYGRAIRCRTCRQRLRRQSDLQRQRSARASGIT
jgi:hypothetical protein